MPLPKPEVNQDREEFIEMCMSDNTMEEEFPENEQRLAVCETQWENYNKGGGYMKFKSKPFDETKDFTFEIKQLNEEKRVFEGYASIFGNVDAYGDIVQKGAFKKTINERKNKIKILWQHNPTQPIGKLTEAKEDDIGLKIKGKISETEKGNEVLKLMKDKVIDELSIGYNTVKKDYDNEGHRLLKEVKLFEVSPVTFAANPLANVTGVKSLTERCGFDEKESVSENMEERELRDAKWKIEDAFRQTTNDLLEDTEMSNKDKMTAFNDALQEYSNLLNSWFESMISVGAKSININTKEGRVLSNTNYERVMDALSLLEDVLSDAEPAKSTQTDDSNKQAGEGDNEPGNHSEDIDKKLDDLLDMTKDFTKTKE